MLFSLQMFNRNILMSTFFFNKNTVKFLKMKQDAVRQESCQKHGKRCPQLYTFWMTLHPPPVAYVLN